MNQTNRLETPQVTDEIHHWEIYFRNVVESKSVCKVRTSHLQQTAREREQIYLKQLSENARSIFARSSLSHRGNAFQKQALELIKLRRRLAPDGSPVHQEAGVFLAIVQIHQAVQTLLGNIEHLLKLHFEMGLQISEVHRLIQQIQKGKSIDSKAIFPVIQTIRSSAADATIDTDDWLHLSYHIASYDLGESEANVLALTGAMQSSYLAAKILRKQNTKLKSSNDQTSRLHQFDVQFESFLVACLLKDVGTWLQKNRNASPARVHHSEISAGLITKVTGLPVGIVRLIREHHECMDGSGLPAGINGTSLHFESRLLAVITRWCELYNQQLAPGKISFIETASDILLKETCQNRWEKLSTNLLLDSLGVRPMKELVPPQFQQDAKPNWQIPRPHFLDAARKKTPATTYQR